MDNFSRFIKHKKLKYIFVCLSIVLPIILIILLENYQESIKPGSGFADLVVSRYFIFAIIEGWVITKIVRYTKIIYDPEYGKKAFIKLNDERLSFIKMRANALSSKLMLYFLLVGILVAGFFDRSIFYTLLITLAGYIITVTITTIYYSKKF